jgi:PadR family transcriptional regulator PadR
LQNNNDQQDFNGRGRGFGRSGGRGMGRGMRWAGDYTLLDVRLVEPALLAFLKKGKLHGYGLLEKMESIGLSSINPSVIYRILRDYEDLGLVISDWDHESSQGPPRRVYTITEEGLTALDRAEAALKESVDRINLILDQIKS